jgi:hypothetical protein
MKPILFFYGSSHAKKLCFNARSLNKITNIYDIQECTKSGATINTLPFPNIQHLQSSDILVIQISGNSLFKRDIMFSNEKGKRTIHLKSFCPQEPEKIARENHILRSHLCTVNCKVLLIDNLYRHLFCCQTHFDKRILYYQKKQNSLFKTFFSELRNVTVINHLKYLGKTSTWLNKNTNLRKLTIDSVHLKAQYYRRILIKILF